MQHPAERLNRIQESQTIGMAKLARALAAEGKDVINLSFGEPDFQTPQHIKDAAKKAIDDGFTFYTPVPGYPELRKAISEKFKNDNHLNYPFDQIVVSTGAKHAIMNTVLALINPGDEVIIPTPYWVSYSEMVKLAEGVPVFVHTTVENDFKPSVEQIKAAITPRTRLFMFSSLAIQQVRFFRKKN
jgi:aspartate aminotransferase